MSKDYELDDFFFIFKHVKYDVVEKSVYPTLELALKYRNALCKKHGISKDTMPIFWTHTTSTAHSYNVTEPVIVG